MVWYKPTTNRATGEFPMLSLQAIFFRTCKMGSACKQFFSELVKWARPASNLFPNLWNGLGLGYATRWPRGPKIRCHQTVRHTKGHFAEFLQHGSLKHSSMVSSSRGLSTPENKVYIFQSHVTYVWSISYHIFLVLH